MKRPRPAANIDSKRLPRKRLLENALAQVAGKEQAIGRFRAQRGKKPQLRRGKILSLIHHSEVERWTYAARKPGGQLFEHTGQV